jgi:hypothetical protein
LGRWLESSKGTKGESPGFLKIIFPEEEKKRKG